MSNNSYFENIKCLELLQKDGSDESCDQTMAEEDICPKCDHRANFRQCNWNNFHMIPNDGTELEVESLTLNLKDIRLTSSDVNRIITACPKLKCLALNMQNFTAEGWNCLIDKVFPDLETLAIDDEIRVYWKDVEQTINWINVISKLENLEDFKLKLSRTDRQFDGQCLRHLTRKLVSFYFEDNSGANNLEGAIRILSRGTGNQLNYLRIGSEEQKETVVKAYEYIGRLSQLKGLNLSAKNCIYFDERIQRSGLCWINQLKHLETLTCRVKSDQTTRFLLDLSDAKFKKNLTKLRLIDADLDGSDFCIIRFAFKNLKSLQLIDPIVDEKCMDQIRLQTTHLDEVVVDDLINILQ